MIKHALTSDGLGAVNFSDITPADWNAAHLVDGMTITNQVTLSGSGLVWYRERPQLDQATVVGAGKPTIVYRGIQRGFSLPLYAANEELFFSEPHVMSRWDEASDIHCEVHYYLDTANNAKRFRLQCTWEHYTPGDVIGTTTHDVEEEVLTGNWAQYTSGQADFVLDYDIDTPDNVACGDSLALRIRRIDKTGAEAEIAGEVVIMAVELHFQCDKFGGVLS